MSNPLEITLCDDFEAAADDYTQQERTVRIPGLGKDANGQDKGMKLKEMDYDTFQRLQEGAKVEGTLNNSLLQRLMNLATVVYPKLTDASLDKMEAKSTRTILALNAAVNRINGWAKEEEEKIAHKSGDGPGTDHVPTSLPSPGDGRSDSSETA